MLQLVKKAVICFLFTSITILHAQSDLSYHLKKAEEATNNTAKIYQFEQAEIVAQFEANMEKLAFIYFNLGQLYFLTYNTEKSIYSTNNQFQFAKKRALPNC